MKTINGIPVYQAVIGLEDGETRMTCISLVDEPAVEVDFQMFAQEKQRVCFAVENEEKHLIFGVVMRANYPMLRLTEEGAPYYIEFTPETIRTMAQKYFKEGMQNNFNLMHNAEDKTEQIEMVQLFIKDSEKGIVPAGFEDISDGSLFGEFKVLDDNIWNDIKEGDFKGFSIEVDMFVEPVNEAVEDEYAEVIELINKIKNKITNG